MGARAKAPQGTPGAAQDKAGDMASAQGGADGSDASAKSVTSEGKSRNPLTDNTNNESNERQKREVSEGKREYPEAYSDFLKAAGLEELLPVLGKAVEQKRLDVLERAIPKGRQPSSA